MAADQSLISASLKEAQSRVALDKTKYYENEVNQQVNTMTNIANIFKQKSFENNEAWEAVAGNTEEMMNSLASEDQLGSMGKSNIAHLKTLKKEFLSAGGNKEKENEVKIKIQKVVKTINRLTAGFGKYGEAYLSDTLDRNASDPEFTNILGRIWEKDGKYEDIDFNWTENGDLEFVVDGFSTTSSMLFDKLILKSDETTNALGKIGVNLEQRGAKGLNNDRAGNIQQVKNLWSGAEGKNRFAATINSSTFGSESFSEAIYNNKGIHKALQELSKGKFDTDGSGTVDAKDFTSDENKQLLLNALTNVHSSNFDFETAKEVAAMWYSDSYLQGKYNDGRGSIENSPKSKSGNYMIGRQSVPKSSIDPTVALLNNNKDYQSDTAWNGVVHKRVNGQYFVYDDAAGGFQPVSRDTVANSIGVLSQRYGYEQGSVEKGKKSNNVGAEMLLGSEKDIVRKFTDKYPSFKFTTEFDINNKAMNISIGDAELEDINLEEEGSLEKIQQFIDENSSSLNLG